MIDYHLENGNQGNMLFFNIRVVCTLRVKQTPKDEYEVKINIIFGISMIDYPFELKIKEIYYFSI
jgi:hypothetical protein